MASDQKVVAALGRPFTLGMLYDAYKDQLVTGFTLWDKKTLEEHRSEHSQQTSTFEVTTSDSIESKSKLLSVEASLKASFLSGLIEVEGSAKYLNDQKKFKNQSRVTLQYKATTSFKQLLMTEIESKNKMNTAVPNKESATHVVTGILYGANAFFVFDSVKLDARSVQQIEGSMKALIKKIPTLEISGKVDIQLTKEEKALADKFSCKFIGDFILPSNPSTFLEAVQTYVDLPKLLKNNQGTVVPLKVWLTPLKKFIPTAAELRGSINTGLLRKAETALEDIKQAEMRCNECLDDEVVQNVPQISEKLMKFKKNCQDFKSQLQQTMEKEFPLTHKGQKENGSVEKLLNDRQNSPFSSNNLNIWMDNREREINIIRSCVEMMKAGTNVRMVPRQSDLDREILALGVEQALCFVFTSVEHVDPYMEQMVQYLDKHDPCDKNVLLSAQQPWYNSNEVFNKMRGKSAALHDFATSLKNNSRFRFLVTTAPNNKYQGATIYHYKDGVLVTEDFSQPSIPDVKKVTSQKDLSWYVCDLTMDPNTVSGWLTLSDGNKKGICGEWKSYPDLPQRFDERPQVLCTKGLTGRHYWEVEWSKGGDNEVGVGVAYNRIKRKGSSPETGLGSNEMSWYFGENKGCLEAWHNGKVWSAHLPSSRCQRVGVYLDWPAGTLTFYDATFKSLKHIYTFTTTFTDPVYPGFWIYNKSSYACLCAV
ncbi:stonustoxin subunit beta-like [Betta splendens]|uniref:Stonustoxin subunit beta-like n=1 Tax=Betta splendens TaxID=158456 RepID=A0A6P7L651_BETSP|nr:stonustoxin subunit beta-like [Betta splendens]XP_055360599.1 stonustoxin subunit beta-like [Betta splendens]